MYSLLLQAEALMKAYPPFVNFFEQTKETIAKSDKTNPRFHAFLKVSIAFYDSRNYFTCHFFL